MDHMYLSIRNIRFAFLIFLLFPVILYSQGDEAVFKKSCGACHSIGRGKLIGPDLGGITGKKDKEWIKRFIRNSVEMINSGDPEAVAIGKEFNNMLMPPFSGTDAELTSIIRYLESVSGKQSAGASADTFLMAATEQNVANGKALFTGEKRFLNGGASCISCHSASSDGGTGGSLAKSLNLSWFTLGGQGIKAMMQSPAFPAMINAYQEQPLTDPEIYDVAAFLKENSKQFVAANTASGSNYFYIFSFVGALSGGLLLFMLWRFRKRNTVNREIFERQLSAEI